MARVFISYVREDIAKAERLASDIKAGHFDVWLDREQLLPGDRWQDAIRQAIRDGHFFIACFSLQHTARRRSYMNEELTIAIEELRRRPTDRTWFLPVLFDPQTLPDRSIGAGETLADFQCVDLDADWPGGVNQLLLSMRRSLIGSAKSSVQCAVADLLARSQEQQEDWMTWASIHGTPRDHEILAALQDQWPHG